MTIQECAEKEGEITILYNPEDQRWYFEINGGGFGQIGEKNGHLNPDTARLELEKFLKNWNGFNS